MENSNNKEVWHRPPRHIIKEMRRKQIAERQAQLDKKTPEERLADLDKLLGVNVGAQRERARLKAKIEARYAEAKIEKTEKPEKAQKAEKPKKENKKKRARKS